MNESKEFSEFSISTTGSTTGSKTDSTTEEPKEEPIAGLLMLAFCLLVWAGVVYLVLS